MARALWNTAKEMADNPSLWQRIKHSKKADPARRYQGDLKHGHYKNLAKRIGRGIMTDGVTKLTQFIPIPIVKDITEKVYDKMSSFAVSMGHKYNLNHAKDVGTKTKFMIKDLDVGDLDRYRWKITDSLQTFNKLATYAVNNLENTAAICNDWGKAMSKYYYVRRRIGKMRVALAGLQETIDMTEAWLTEVETSKGKWGSLEEIDKEFIMISSEIVKIEGDEHAKCDSNFCVNKTGISSGRKHRSFFSRLSKVTNFIIDVGAPDFTDKDLYGKHDKGGNKGKSSYLYAE